MYKLLLLLCLAGLGASCKGDASAITDEDYTAHRQSLYEKEQEHPLHFLTLKSSHRKNWIGQTVVTGTITNTAALSSYTAVRLQMLCFDSNGRRVEEHEDVIKKIWKPKDAIDFTLRYRLPKSTDSIAVSVMSASAVAE